METTTHCDGKLLKRMLVAGGRWLGLHRGILNELNVFPVPDGDTGTNLSLTMRGALTPLLAHEAPCRVDEVSASAARGALLAARGNSGVILSQILHGFSSGLASLEKASTEDMARAFTFAQKYAYGAVQQPREGTILTVLRSMAEEAERICHSVACLPDFFRQITAVGQEALVSSRDMLAVLKDAGVVDAGGLGLIYVFEGMLKVTEGKQLTIPHDGTAKDFTLNLPDQHSLESDINYNYCTEFLVDGTKLTPADVTPQLEKLGDSIVIAKTEDLLKVHIHTNTPDLVELLVTPGCTRYRRKVEDMREQNKKRREDYQRGISPAQQQASTAEFKGELQLLEAPSAETVEARSLPPMVAISAGEGLAAFFQAWKVVIVPGGQTLNPSTAEILAAINQAHEQEPQREVLVFPNNSNCIAACDQAKALCSFAVKVVPTRCPSQLVAVLNSSATLTSSQPDKLSRGGVTRAIKDAFINGHEIRLNDYMATLDGELVGVSDSFVVALSALLDSKRCQEVSRLVLVAGQDCDSDELELGLTQAVEGCAGARIEFLWGGQPHHQIWVTLE